MANQRGRAPHSLSKEQQNALVESDALRAKNPNKIGPDAPKKAKAPKPKQANEQEET